MIEKKKQVKIEDQLLQARSVGLERAKEMDAMRAHGKVLGMDTFSWMNPQVDMLVTLLSSFPFDILWIGTHQQIESCLSHYPELNEKIETIIIHDTARLQIGEKEFKGLHNIACVKGVNQALDFVKAFKLRNGVFMYTNEGENITVENEQFEAFIELYK